MQKVRNFTFFRFLDCEGVRMKFCPVCSPGFRPPSSPFSVSSTLPRTKSFIWHLIISSLNCKTLLGMVLLSPFRMCVRNIILPEDTNRVCFFTVLNLCNLLYFIAKLAGSAAALASSCLIRRMFRMISRISQSFTTWSICHQSLNGDAKIKNAFLQGSGSVYQCDH